MLTIYFSGTGNTTFVAELFSARMGGNCLSIEDDADFAAEFAANDTIAFCYPIYGSRVPLIMRQFAARHADVLRGKELVILVTQLIFSGDGARAFCDIFPKGHFNIIYAEHFIMPNNVSNLAILPQTSEKSARRQMRAAESKISRICRNIDNGTTKRRGFSIFSRFLGAFQGIPWPAMEAKAMSRINIFKNCTACGLCVNACPMKNLEINDSNLIHKDSCTICYRCVNLCPHRAITVFFRTKPRWQYHGLPKK